MFLKILSFVFFLWVLFLATLLITWDVRMHTYESTSESVRYAAPFRWCLLRPQRVTVTADFATWPALSKYILISLMFMGGCAGSTAGGMKCIRIMLLAKYGFREIRRMLFPKAVFQIKIQEESVPRDVISQRIGLFCDGRFGDCGGYVCNEFFGVGLNHGLYSCFSLCLEHRTGAR